MSFLASLGPALSGGGIGLSGGQGGFSGSSTATSGIRGDNGTGVTFGASDFFGPQSFGEAAGQFLHDANTRRPLDLNTVVWVGVAIVAITVLALAIRGRK